MSDRPVPPQQGDEEELFERYNGRLRRMTAARVNTSWEIVDDACACAWMKLISNQPRRETAFGWLVTVARNEAVRLDQLSRDLPLADELDGADRLASRDGRVEDAHGLAELRDRLQALPLRQRELVFLSAAGWRHRELAERLGVSETRIQQLLKRASVRMREQDIRDQDLTSPRGQRLREIEDNPPTYIVASIGRAPRADPKVGREGLRREWKRLVLEIEDYRTANGITDRVLPLGRKVNGLQREAIGRRIAGFRDERGLSMGFER